MIKNKRLDFIASLIDKNTNTLLDIGTDHGYLIKKAFDNNLIQNAIATDINELPLNNAKSNLLNYPVKYILTDGFKGINDSYDTVVIAGMGGSLIADILKDAKDDQNIKYILQANNKLENLREWLNNNNFEILDEHVIFDKLFYVVLEVKRGSMNLTNEEILLGPILKSKENSLSYYKYLYDWYNTIIRKHKLTNVDLVDKANLIKKHIESKK